MDPAFKDALGVGLTSLSCPLAASGSLVGPPGVQGAFVGPWMLLGLGLSCVFLVDLSFNCCLGLGLLLLPFKSLAAFIRTSVLVLYLMSVEA